MNVFKNKGRFICFKKLIKNQNLKQKKEIKILEKNNYTFLVFRLLL